MFFGNISVLEEEIKEKEADGNRKVFKSLVKFDNTKKEILPQMIFRKKNIESNKIIEEILLREKINKQSLNLENARMNSYLNLILVQVQKNQKKENKVELSPYLEELFYSLGQLKNYIYEMFIITLQDQAMFNMGNLIKMNIHLDREDKAISKVHGEVPIFLVPENNYYPEEIANLIFETIEQINGIFRTMVSDSTLLCKEEGEKVGAYGVKEKALNLYVKKGDDEIFIENESAGIKKIISILSALVHFIKGENALVVIDELDAHIFEYLLAVILKKISEVAKGQLIFTAHNLSPLERLSRENIIITSIDDEKVSYNYLKNITKTTNLRQKYIRSQTVWSEDNIIPINLNEAALSLYLKKLVK